MHERAQGLENIYQEPSEEAKLSTLDRRERVMTAGYDGARITQAETRSAGNDETWTTLVTSPSPRR